MKVSEWWREGRVLEQSSGATAAASSNYSTIAMQRGERKKKNGPRSQLIECKRFVERTGREWSERPSGAQRRATGSRCGHRQRFWSKVRRRRHSFVRRWFCWNREYSSTTMFMYLALISNNRIRSFVDVIPSLHFSQSN